MAEPVECFWLERTGTQRRWLRRYAGRDSGGECEATHIGIHNAQFSISDGLEHLNKNNTIRVVPVSRFRRNPNWPTRCECGYVFREEDEWQILTRSIYAAADGREFTIEEAPAGAMWELWWLPKGNPWRGPDGRALSVKLPDGHDWWIDSRASNCTMPDDNEHKCWVRHGEPPRITVDKNGKTCAAGAGSIASKGWHGFLRNGMLVG